MSTKAKKWKARTFVVLIFVIAITSLLTIIMNIRQSAQVEMQTDIDVRAFVGNSAESKLGGIQFAVSDRWEHDRVIFSVRGFNEGLKLNSVTCYKHDGEFYYFYSQWKPDWNTWLERFQEVLTEATTGEKLNTPNTSSSK